MKNSMARIAACSLSLTLCALSASYAAEAEKAPQWTSAADGVGKPSLAEAPSTPQSATPSTPPSTPPAGISPEEKASWQQSVTASKIGAGVLYAAGAAGVIAGIAFIADGNDQRNNAQFKQKGNVFTNEDDVNAGNDKVLKGDVSLLAGGLAIGGAVLMTLHVHHLNQEGQQKGFTTSYTPTQKGGTLSVAYFYKF